MKLWSLNESKINSLFTPTTPAQNTDCSGAATIIRAKGIINSINPGEFDALGLTSASIPFKQIGGWNDSMTKFESPSKEMSDVEIGYQTLLLNKKDYVASFGHAGMEGEHVIKVGDDLYYGFGFTESDSFLNYEGWKKRLSLSYNSMGGPQITSKDVPGYIGFVIKADYLKLSQMLFDLRNKK